MGIKTEFSTLELQHFVNALKHSARTIAISLNDDHKLVEIEHAIQTVHRYFELMHVIEAIIESNTQRKENNG